MSIILPPVLPQYGMTHQEMISFVSSEIRNSSINSLITTWINMIILELAALYMFGTLHKYDSKVSSPGIPDVTLETDIYWLKSIQIESDVRKLIPLNESIIADGSPDYRIKTGTTTHYYLNGIVLGLFRVPDTTKTLNYSYQRRPLKLADLNAYSDLPAEWHPLIAQKAATMGYRQEGNYEGASVSERTESRIWKGLSNVVYRRPDQTLNLQSSSRLSRPARPKLPSNFPQ
jgi:hypothetical protein